MKTKLLIFVNLICIYSYNISFAQNDCAQNNFGHFCFTNKLSKEVSIIISTGGWYGGQELTLLPNETQCFYELETGTFNYWVFDPSIAKNNNDNVDKAIIKQGQIYVDQCKSKTLTLSVIGGSNISEGNFIFTSSELTKQNITITDIAGEKCATTNFGNFCFTNKLSKEVSIITSTGGWYGGQKLTLLPNETQCFYELGTGTFNYWVFDPSIAKNNNDNVDKAIMKQGQIYIQKCKSKTLTLNTIYNSTMSEVNTIPTIQETPQQNSIIEAEKTEENTTRGSGDPLKGLNVSKAKEVKVTSGNYYALIIGIDKYTGQWHTLNTAVNDAKAIEKTLREKYKTDKFYTLYDEQATRTAIMNDFENLVNTLTENDNLLIYFSGHGDFKKTMNKGYWVPIDAKTEAASDLISNNDIQTFLASIKTKHTLLISDACFSGDIFRGNTITVPFEDSEKYYTKVYNLYSRQALTSGGIEPVMDGGKDGHSVFAYYLLKNLENNTNKYYDIGQLYDNLKVPVVNNSDQTPHLDPLKNTGDEGGQFLFIKK